MNKNKKIMEKRKDVRQLIIDAAEKFNNKTAFVYNDVEYSFAKLQNDVFKLANGLLDLGLRKGDKVAIYLPNCIECLFILCNIFYWFSCDTYRFLFN